MSHEFVAFRDVADFERVIAESSEQPVVIFKHSATCGTSAMAHEEMEALFDAGGIDTPVYLVPVRAQRQISDAIAARFGVRHESPQVLIVRDGKVAWTASHFRVTADAVARQIAAVSGAGAGRP